MSTMSSTSVKAQLNLDTNFNAGVTDADTQVYISKPLSDGKILVGGNFRIINGVEKTALTRLNADGSVDNSFNVNNSGPNNGVYEIVQLSDGKFLIGGFFTAYNGVAKSGIVRINADGSIDNSFNPNGTGTTGTVQTIGLQADGKILISGSGLSAYNGTTRYSVIRLNADGTLDTTFSSPFTSSQFIEEVDVQTDGKILIGGSFGIGSPLRIDVARLNSDGSLDASFNSSGGGTDGGGVYAMTIQPDGKILIGGAFKTYNGSSRQEIARLNANGSLDTTFNPNVSIGIDGGEYFALQSDGKILIAGGFGSVSSNISLIRLNADGSSDTAFNLRQTNGAGYNVSQQSDGKILLSGFFTIFDGRTRRNFVRLNFDGTLDSSFNAAFSTFSTVNALAQQSDGKIIAAGTFNSANGVPRANVSRFNTDGSVDSSFSVGTGTFPDSNSSSNVINDIAIQPDGKVLIAGSFGGYNGASQTAIARLNNDGSVDNSFTSPFSNFVSTFIFDVFVQPDGKILVGGNLSIDFNTSTQFLYRLNANGSFDTAFTGNPDNTVRVITRQSDGKTLIGGSFSIYSGQSRNRIVRLNTDSSVDTTFSIGTGFNGTILDLAQQPDGKIIAVGTFNAFNGSSISRVARLNANGSLDTTFNVGNGASGTVYSIALQADGKIVIGGLFSAYNSVVSNRLVRLNSNGSIDSTYVSGFDDDARFSVRRVLTQTDGKLVVGGVFKTYNGAPRNSLLRLTAMNATRRTLFDFDGDGKADQSVFRSSNSGWYLLGSQSGFTSTVFGNSTDKLVPADYDGDGKTDIAVFRDGNWYWINSSTNTFNAVQFGQANDIPVPADYSGDGRAELAVYRGGNWYALNITSNQFQATQFGIGSDKPVPADYDGDGKTDLAVFRDGNWYIQRSTAGFSAVQFGNPTDKLTVGDYDGDGKADEAVFRSGIWYVLGSTQGFTATQFGTSTDIPVAADYDGDGKTDVAVFRNDTWYAQRSQQGFGAVQFGAINDKPIPAVFVP